MGVDLKNDRAVGRWKETQNYFEKMESLRRERELTLLVDEKIAFSKYDDISKEELQILYGRGDLEDVNVTT